MCLCSTKTYSNDQGSVKVKVTQYQYKEMFCPYCKSLVHNRTKLHQSVDKEFMYLTRLDFQQHCWNSV